jgi:hypothetical protein
MQQHHKNFQGEPSGESLVLQMIRSCKPCPHQNEKF